MSERRNTGERRVADRRRSTRSLVDCRIRLLSAKSPSQIVQGNLLDASVSGARLKVSQAVAVGEKLLVEAKRGSKVLCNVTVQVIWCEREQANQFTLGCESLTELSPRQLTQLKSAAVDESALPA
jgi:hypothetical protein